MLSTAQRTEFGQNQQHREQSQYVSRHEAFQVNRIDALLHRTWFTRTWAVQDLVFGSQVTVMSGDSEIGRDTFVQGILGYKLQLRLLLKDGPKVQR